MHPRNHCVGSGHGSLALREDWQEHLKNAHDKVGVSSVRFHGILDDDVGPVNGVNDYSFVNIDKIYDYLLSIDMKPYVEISFMPRDLASGTDTTFHYKGNITPPKDWSTWNDFIKQWMQHLITRYTIDEVSKWKFEVWNEPNCGFYVHGGCCGCTCPYFDDYMMLYSNTAQAIKSVDSRLKVGGPSTAQLCWIDQFLTNVTANKLPVDFVSSHLYPTDPQNNKNDGVNAFYNTLKTAGDVLNKYKSLNLTLYLSEYNSGLYGGGVDNHDTNYAASFMVFQAAKLQSLITDNNYGWMSYWTFSDVFEEGGFGSAPFHNEFGMQTIRGIAKPVFRALELLYTLGSETAYNTSRIDTNNDDGTVQVYTLKNPTDSNRYTIFAGNWNLNGETISSETLEIQLEGNGAPKSAKMYRIDEQNVNPVGKWDSMNKPTYPTNQQLQALNSSAQLISTSAQFSNINSNTVQFNVTIPEYGVVVIDVQY